MLFAPFLRHAFETRNNRVFHILIFQTAFWQKEKNNICLDVFLVLNNKKQKTHFLAIQLRSISYLIRNFAIQG